MSIVSPERATPTQVEAARLLVDLMADRGASAEAEVHAVAGLPLDRHVVSPERATPTQVEAAKLLVALVDDRGGEQDPAVLRLAGLNATA